VRTLLHWPGLMIGIFGTPRRMAKRAGSATSAKKSCVEPGEWEEGGRPRKAGEGVVLWPRDCVPELCGPGIGLLHRYSSDAKLRCQCSKRA
jgi:hypothetical protein